MNKIKVLKRHLDTSPAEDFDIHPELNVLIEGETGTGKTHLAKQLHEESQQIGNFIHLNLSAYSSGTLESELFGHCKGAFTGAVSDKDGAFKLANKGTLFLDEIDSISIELQTKLLLFLDNGFYYPVGSNTPQKIKTRLIVASGRSLEQLVRKERMRRDFYFRISSEEVIYLKPLRESSDRMKQLIADFEKKDFVTIHPKLQEMYMRYEWPGNIRQFVSHLKKKKLKSRSSLIRYCELDSKLLKIPVEDNDQREIIPFKELKYQYFLKSYSQCGGDISLTAKKLCVSGQTVRSILAV